VRALCIQIVSGGGVNALVTHRSGGAIQRFLTVHNMDGLFAGWVTPEEGFPRKPDPAMFLAALQRFDLAAEESLAIGDERLISRRANPLVCSPACLANA